MEIKDYLHLYIGCEVIVDMRRYLGNSIGKNVDLSSVKMSFDSINRNSDIDQRWGVTKSDGIEYYNCFDELCRLYDHFVHSSNLKPILRKLSDMTEEECDKYGIAYLNGEYTKDCFEADATYGTTFKVYGIKSLSERVIQMCKDGWDLFDLIPAGLAIDKTSLKN